MSNLIALHAPVRRTDPITHPSWCEHGACENNLDLDTVTHRQRLSRWEAMDGDLRIEVALIADDEHTVWDGQWIAHPAQAWLKLRSLCSDYNVPCTVEHHVPINIEAYLDATEVRRLAAELLDVADRIDAAGVAKRTAAGRSQGPELAVDQIDDRPLCDRVECRDCVQSFCPDSSPHLDRCYECAARVDGEVLV